MKFKKLRKKLIYIKFKKASPVTPSMRHYKYVTKHLLSKQNRIFKSLIFKIKRSCGKSSFSGRTLVWGRNSGCKKLYRKICFFNQDVLGIILFSIYDPNRTSFVSAFFNFFTYKISYIPSVHQLYSGSITGCRISKRPKYFLGFRYPLNFLTIGSILCLLSIKPKKIAQYSRSAGTFSQLISKTKDFCKIKLSSGSIIQISSLCFGTLGVLSNTFNRLTVIGKAGRNRLKGFKPKVRGIAMNPVDNPHGGRSNGGCSWVTPWGKTFLFKKTSRSKYKEIVKLKKSVKSRKKK